MDTENYLLKNCKFHDINPLVCGQQHCKPCYGFGPASREYYLLHYVISGQGFFLADTIKHTLQAGECFVIRPDEITYYEADAACPWHYVWVGFECSIPMPQALSARVIASKKLGEIFARFQQLENIQNGREAFLCACIWEIFAELDDTRESEADRLKNYIEQAVSCIENEYMTNLTVQDIAARLNLNRSYFSTLFKKHTGTSPQNYLLNYRLTKAAHLLAEQHLSVTQTAISTGYSDVFTFSKTFKKKFGVSPLVYQKSGSSANSILY